MTCTSRPFSCSSFEIPPVRRTRAFQRATENLLKLSIELESVISSHAALPALNRFRSNKSYPDRTDWTAPRQSTDERCHLFPATRVAMRDSTHSRKRTVQGRRGPTSTWHRSACSVNPTTRRSISSASPSSSSRHVPQNLSHVGRSVRTIHIWCRQDAQSPELVSLHCPPITHAPVPLEIGTNS